MTIPDQQRTPPHRAGYLKVFLIVGLAVTVGFIAAITVISSKQKEHVTAISGTLTSISTALHTATANNGTINYNGRTLIINSPDNDTLTIVPPPNTHIRVWTTTQGHTQHLDAEHITNIPLLDTGWCISIPGPKNNQYIQVTDRTSTPTSDKSTHDCYTITN